MRSLAELDIVYCWADGLYVKAGLEDGKAALLVIIGATSTGEKVLLSVTSGQRESTDAWLGVLRDLKARGLRPMRLMITDGASRNLDYARSDLSGERGAGLLESQDGERAQPGAVEEAGTGEAVAAQDDVCRNACEVRGRPQAVHQAIQGLYPKAMAALERDWERMVTYYDFPVEHWIHLRTTNVVESPFASVRLRTNAGKRFKRVNNAASLIWKLLTVAEKTFRRLHAPQLLSAVAAGAKYVDGKPVPPSHERIAA